MKILAECNLYVIMRWYVKKKEIENKMLASIIDQLLQFFASLGYFGVALALMIEIIPSEIVLSYAGFLVADGKISFVGAVIAGTIGGTLAQIFLYWLGYYGGRPVVEKYGKYLLINKHHLDIAENWFKRYGAGVIFRHVLSQSYVMQFLFQQD